LKYVRALWSGLAYLSRYNSGWFCHKAEGRATIQAELSHQEDYLNKSYKARLSNLILSKAYPLMVYIAM
jgi:hypothetical protein